MSHRLQPSILFWGVDSVGPGADTRFLPPGWDDVMAGTTDNKQIVATRAGRLQSLFVRHNTAAGNGNSVSYMVMVNGIAAGITVSLATGAVGQASDLANGVSISRGDRISIRAIKALIIADGIIRPTATLELA